MNNILEENNCIEKFEKCNLETIKLQIDLIRENEKYNSTVCSIGYISMLAVLCYTNDFINPKIFSIILFLFGLSVFLFVFFEVIKTFRNNEIATKQIYNYKKYSNNQITESILILENNNAEMNTWNWFTKIAKYWFIASTITILISAIILFIQIIKYIIK